MQGSKQEFVVFRERINLTSMLC